MAVKQHCQNNKVFSKTEICAGVLGMTLVKCDKILQRFATVHPVIIMKNSFEAVCSMPACFMHIEVVPVPNYTTV